MVLVVDSNKVSGSSMAKIDWTISHISNLLTTTTMKFHFISMCHFHCCCTLISYLSTSTQSREWMANGIGKQKKNVSEIWNEKIIDINSKTFRFKYLSLPLVVVWCVIEMWRRRSTTSIGKEKQKVSSERNEERDSICPIFRFTDTSCAVEADVDVLLTSEKLFSSTLLSFIFTKPNEQKKLSKKSLNFSFHLLSLFSRQLQQRCMYDIWIWATKKKKRKIVSLVVSSVDFISGGRGGKYLNEI